MSKSVSTRRSFLKGGALLAVPLASSAGPVLADGDLKARLARLEDEAAIRELHQTWLRRINAGNHNEALLFFADPKIAMFDRTVRFIASDAAAEPDAIEIKGGGKAAVGRFGCLATFETDLAKDSAFTQMAHAQGNGFVRRTERCVLNIRYVKIKSAWAIAQVEIAPT